MRVISRLPFVAVLATAVACLDTPALFEPSETRTRVTLPAGEVHLHETDTVRVAVEHAPGVALAAQLLLLDSAGTEVWRSEQVQVADGRATIPVRAVAAGVPRGAPLLATVSVIDPAGQRFYASDDSVLAPRLSGAARRPARLWAGRRVVAAAAAGGRGLTADPERSRAYFPIPGSQSVGVLDLSGEGRILDPIAVGVRPDVLAYRAGLLAVLGAGGDELDFVRLGSPQQPASRLPALQLELDTTFVGAVRPDAGGIAIGCADAGCSAPYALLPSAVQVLKGAARADGQPSVLRMVAGPGAGSSREVVVLPRFDDSVRGDTSVSAVVFGLTVPDGRRTEVLRRENVSACLALSLGGAIVESGRAGTAYVAPASERTPCGPGTALLRVDGVGTPQVSVSALAVRTTTADQRIARVSAIEVSDDHESLLAIAGDAVLVLDPYLRVLGSIPAPDARAVAWLRGAGSDRFAVADATGVTVYDASRLIAVARVPIGPTTGGLVVLRRPAGGALLAATVDGGFVVASAPDPEQAR